MLQAPNDQTVLVAQTTKFQCVVDGSPKPRTLWKHNGIMLNGNGKKPENIEFFDESEILVIQNTQLSDGGVYECIGRSPLDHVEEIKRAALLTVIGKSNQLLHCHS